MSDNIKPIAVINKATDILECLVKNPDGISLGEVSSQVQLNKSTVYRILQTLKQSTYVMQDPSTGFYKLGGRFLMYSSFISAFDKPSFILPYMHEYSDQTGYSTNLAILENDFSLTISSYAPNRSSSIKLQAKVRFMAELYRVASGKVFLSSFDDERLESYFNKHPLIPVTDYTITDISRLKEDISLVKSRGYSVEYMENEDRIISLASPIKDHTGNIIAALAIMVLSQSISSRDIPLIGEGLKETAQRISEALGDKSKVL